MKKIIKALNYSLQNALITLFAPSIAISMLIGVVIANEFDIHANFMFANSGVTVFNSVFFYILLASGFTYLYFFLRKIKTNLFCSGLHILSICILFFYAGIQPFDYKTIFTLQVIASAIFLLNVYYTFQANETASEATLKALPPNTEEKKKLLGQQKKLEQ